MIRWPTPLHHCMLLHCINIYTRTHTPDPAEYYLNAALQDGFIPHKDDLFLFHGPGGVGKSSLIAMLLGKQRKLIRDSTAVAEEPLHVCPARDVSNQTFTADWELVGNDRMSRMIAHTSHHLISSKRAGEQEKKTEETQAAEEGIQTSTAPEKKSKIVENGQTTEEEIQPSTATATEAFLAEPKPVPKHPKKNAFTKLWSGLKTFAKKSIPFNLSGRRPRQHHGAL